MSDLKIYLAQINNVVGDLEVNCQMILREIEKASKEKCDLVVFPEMTICGYPCDDLWQKRYFFEEIEKKVEEICKKTQNFECAILIGAPIIVQDLKKREKFHNCAILIEKGEILKVINKKTLPNYGVFDEKRYFSPSDFMSFVEFRGQTLAILICEDLWDLKNLYLLGEQVFDLAISINSSPFSLKKHEKRLKIAKNFAKTLEKPLIYVNQVGGQDSLVFDGNSFILDKFGKVSLKMKDFDEDFSIVKIEKNGEIEVVLSNFEQNLPEKCQNHQIYSACLLGLKDYVKKSGFQKVLLGMSGGIDSALVATLAVDAFGSENVILFALPTKFNSNQSMIDAKEAAKNLNVELRIVEIEDIFQNMLKNLGKVKNELTFQNLQSRIRGNILMAFSNETGALLLSTGNKSELAMGYATIYGDMCGAFNPIKDLYKMQVFELANWRNENFVEISAYKKLDLIPQNIIKKAPSAELAFDQKDSDSLPEYEILDKILEQIIEEEKSVDEIVKMGFEEKLVKKVAKSFYLSEYKRRQSVIGVKISKMSFDKDRRYPINNKFIK